MSEREATDLQVEPAEATIRPGEHEQFQAVVEFDGDLQAMVQEGVTWTTTDAEIATVDSTGLAVGESGGSVEVTAEFGELSDSAVLDVTEVTALEVRAPEESIAPGASEQLQAVAEFEDGLRMDVTEMTEWSSADPGVLAFHDEEIGVVTGQSGGTVEVTADFGGAASVTDVEVTRVLGLDVRPAEVTLEPAGSHRLEAVAELADGTEADVGTVAEWSSSNESVATVSDIGLARGQSRGSAELVAEVGDQSAAATATVEQSVFAWLDRQLDTMAIPFGWVRDFVDWATVELSWLFAAIRWPVEQLLAGFDGVLQWLPWYVVVPLIGLITWWRLGSWKTAVVFMASLVLLGVLAVDIWAFAMTTLAMIITAVIASSVIGIPIGIWSARNDRVWSTVRPALDAMQTIHPFIYLIPVVMFFGIGTVPGTIATIVFALPPVVRLTNLGIRQVPGETVEAARAFGSTDRQTLFEVQLPLARPAIMQGVNQSLMLAYSMVVIAAIVAAGGLGQLIYRATNRVDIPGAVSSGVAVLILAIILDRLSQTRQSDPARE